MAITVEPAIVPLSRPADPVVVALYDPTAAAPDCFAVLPGVRCVSVTRREGAQPSAARFRYAFRTGSAPSHVEDVWGHGLAPGAGIVRPDDRVVVLRLRPDGRPECLFDGFAAIPELHLDAGAEMATFEAVGVEVREWDAPLAKCRWRDGAVPASADRAYNREIDAPIRFNPDGHANAAPLPDFVVGTDATHPSFIDHRMTVEPDGTGDPINLRYWTLDMAVRYCLWRGLTGGAEPRYVKVLGAASLDGFFRAAGPTGDGPIDYDDDATFEYAPILIPDLDVTGMPWPVAVAKLCEPHGFTFRFDLGSDAGGKPTTTLAFYRKDDAAPLKSVMLQPAGRPLDPARTNLGSASLRRDGQDLYNVAAIDAGPERFEVSVVLAPGFAIAAGDASTPEDFRKTDPDYDPKDANLKYRSFIADETGEGHWSLSGGAWVYGFGVALDLDRVFMGGWREPAEGEATGDRNYALRRRPGLKDLVTIDEDGRPLEARLDVALLSKYSGSVPGVYDPSRDSAGVVWVRVAKGGWKLDPDRLGILVTASDPNSFGIGVPDGAVADTYLAGGLLNLVECLAASTTALPKVVFRLTCTIESDIGLEAESSALTALSSPTRFNIARRLDVRDRYHREYVSGCSIYAATPGIDAEPELVRDDLDAATALAEARARGALAPPLGGSLTIPRLTTAYGVGDKIDRIDGRGIDLSVGGGSSGGSPLYPSVAAITWDFDGRQATSLSLADFRGDRLALDADLRTRTQRRRDRDRIDR